MVFLRLILSIEIKINRNTLRRIEFENPLDFVFNWILLYWHLLYNWGNVINLVKPFIAFQAVGWPNKEIASSQ